MPARTQRLSAATSVALDVVRFGAALAVAFAHVTQRFFSIGWPDLIDTIALPAVAVFFVLSGFVIRYVTCMKYATLGEYAIDRASRIYSVVLPAILFTIVADLISYHANPHFYLTNWGHELSHPVFRVAANVTLLSQIWSHDIGLFSNGPMWSLSFEWMYYVLYGVTFYLAGGRRVLWSLAVLAVMGPHMIMLLPLWAVGCVVHDAYRYISAKAIPALRLNLSMAALCAAVALLWAPVTRAIFAVKRYETLFFWRLHHKPLDIAWVNHYYPTGIAFCFLLLWGALAFDRVRLQSTSRLARWVRLLSEGTFPIYLLHFPLLVLIASLVVYDHGSVAAKITIFLVTVVVGVVAAVPTNRLKDWMRRKLRSAFLSQEKMPPARPLEAVS